MTTDRIINVVLFAGLFILTLYTIFTKQSDCEKKCHEGVKKLADDFGKEVGSLDSKTARDFYNYLQG